MTPDPSDFAELREHFDKAHSVREKIGSKNGYPDYPEEIRALMKYLSFSPWCDRGYQPSQTNSILARIDSATLDEVRSVLTAILRSERFCDGAWKRIMTDGTLQTVVTRAGQLV